MSLHKKEIERLVTYLNKCRNEYYNNNKPSISDEQYDTLFDELKKLEEEFGIVLSNSPTQQVGYNVVSELPKVKHKNPLLSLDKTKTFESVLKFKNNKNVLYMHKLDGLTIQLTYEDGRLVRAETRGDGFIGEDITHNAKTFIGLPLTIPTKEKVLITGEAIITKTDFDVINNSLTSEDRYANPRNLVSGSVRQLDSYICSKRNVRFIVWNANDLSTDGTMYSGLMKADSYGFDIVHFWQSDKKETVSDIKSIFTNMRNLANTKSIPIDGIVIMYDNIDYGNSLGRTSHHFRNGIAYKFYDDGYTTNVIGMDYTIGKTGVLTPTVIFDPVSISGTTVTRASLHNISILKTLNICVGDEIEVYKANEIIPQVRSNNTYHEDKSVYKRTIPKSCPYCGCNTKVVGTDVQILKCTNSFCLGKLVKKMCAFTGKSGMDIVGLSEKTLEKFIYKGFIKSYVDIFTIVEKHEEEISKLEGFGEKSITSLQQSLDKCKQTSLAKVLCALNIDNVGKQNAIVLAKYYNDDPALIVKEFEDNKSHTHLLSLGGFGDVIASSIISYFTDKNNLEEFKELISFLNFSINPTVKQGCLQGKTFVITGSLNLFKNRNELIDTIQTNGGTVDNSVKGTTSYLINNDIHSTSSKNKKAMSLNIPIINETEFMNMLNSNTPEVRRKKLF